MEYKTLNQNNSHTIKEFDSFNRCVDIKINFKRFMLC